ncbi:hypothetical protein P3T37_000450 [Kitasatospora sp. MAA4]|nr:hypothetical protein [Kitasatospora sp. MAA4]
MDTNTNSNTLNSGDEEGFGWQRAVPESSL